MWAVRAFLLGGMALGLVSYALATTLAVLAQEGSWESLHAGLGPFLLVAVDREDGATVTTFGSGLVALALLGGVVNVAAAGVLRRRNRNPHGDETMP